MSSVADAQLERPTNPAAATRPVVVAHLLPNLNVGGMERLLVEMLSHTDARRIDSRVICTGPRGDLADEMENLGVRVLALDRPPGRNLRLPFQLARTLRTEKVDVLHSHGPYAHFYGAIAAKLAGGVPLVHTKHGFLWPFTRRRAWQNRLASRWSARVVAVSHDLAQRASATEGLPTNNLEVIHNGIDVERFAQASLDSMDDSPTAIMVARFSSEKDFESLLRAASIVLKRFPRFRLELVGDGPLKNSSQETAATLGIADAVHFMGNRYDVPARLASACFFVLSTNTEGLSISLLEGMAAGLPVVATAVGGNPEVVVEGETGFLVPRSSPETLADRILWLLDHPDRAKAMGASSRQRVRDAFDVRATVRAYEKLYLQLAGRGGQLPAAGSA